MVVGGYAIFDSSVCRHLAVMPDVARVIRLMRVKAFIGALSKSAVHDQAPATGTCRISRRADND